MVHKVGSLLPLTVKPPSQICTIHLSCSSAFITAGLRTETLFAECVPRPVITVKGLWVEAPDFSSTSFTITMASATVVPCKSTVYIRRGYSLRFNSTPGYIQRLPPGKFLDFPCLLRKIIRDLPTPRLRSPSAKP